MITKKIKEQKGITLMSVVIVIIVLLILVGVSISQINNSNGILQTSKTAVSAYKEKSIREKVELKIDNLNLEKMTKTYENANLDDVLKLKESDNEITDAFKDGNNVILIIDDYECKINENLEVESINIYNNNPNTLKQIKRNVKYCTFYREEV